MGEIIDLRRGLAAAASLSVIAGLLAACSPGPSSPAPVYTRGVAPSAAKASPPPAARDNTVFTVRQGDTAIDIAHDHHVPLGALIAANKLRSPYLIHPGDQMLIPDGGVPPQMAAIPPRPTPSMAPPQTIATLPPPSSAQVAAAASPPAPTPIITIPPSPAPPLPAPPPEVAAIPPRPTTPAQIVTAQPQPVPPPQAAAATTPAPPPSAPPIPTKVTAEAAQLDQHP